jgi:ATP-dependent RNA helicase DDX23/PRP28
VSRKSAPNRVPISLEEILQQKQAQQSQESKPVFLTKAQRREMALKQHQQQAEIQRQQREASLSIVAASFSSAPPAPPTPSSKHRELDDGHRNDRVSRHHRDHSDRNRDRSRSRSRERTRDSYRYDDRRDTENDRDRRERRRSRSREDVRSMREPHQRSVSKLQGPVDFEIDSEKLENERRKELEAIRLEKLGLKPKHKRQVAAADKNKFKFEWDASEDTAAAADFLYKERTERSVPSSRSGTSIPSRFESNDDKSHWSSKKLSDMTPRDWRIFREDHKIVTKGGSVPNPLRSWKEADLPDWLMMSIQDAKYEKPSPVQMQAIPIGLQGRDLIGLAETGSGKTAAFVLPMLCYIDTKPPITQSDEHDGPYALILAPARELAIQIDEEVRKFCDRRGYRSVCLIGGVPIEEQDLQLRKGAEVVVATPGRLIEALDLRYVALNRCNYVVLDEADRMIDLGFEPQLLKILEAMPTANMKSENAEEAEKQQKDHRNDYRRTIMFSATMPPPVERIAQLYLRHPATVVIGEVGKAVDRITQNVLWVRNEADKRNKLENLLAQTPPPILIFVNQKKTADFIAKYVGGLGRNLQAAPLHSGRSQEQREHALEQFKRGEIGVLVATDLAGRGLDVKGLKHVINFDLPKSIEDYTHRIGRTGRAGEKGLASSFLANDDTDIMFDLKQMLTKTRSSIPKELSEHPASHSKPTASGGQMSKRDAAPITM